MSPFNKEKAGGLGLVQGWVSRGKWWCMRGNIEYSEDWKAQEEPKNFRAWPFSATLCFFIWKGQSLDYWPFFLMPMIIGPDLCPSCSGCPGGRVYMDAVCLSLALSSFLCFLIALALARDQIPPPPQHCSVNFCSGSYDSIRAWLHCISFIDLGLNFLILFLPNTLSLLITFGIHQW